MKSRTLSSLLLLFPLIVLTELRAATTPPLPNVIVILTDDQGRGDYSAFGTKDIRTPHMDRLFREGMTFQNFYASSCVCSPTRAALMTGCYPDRVGVPGVIRTKTDNSWGYLDPKVSLLPKVLKPADYHTAIIGKWHLGMASPNIPNDRGFDHFKGFLGDMMDDYLTHRREGENLMRHNRETIDPKGHATDLFTDWACDYIRERATQKSPFFLYLAYNAPHDPVQPLEEWVAKVKAREPGMATNRTKLVALIEHLDDGIGKVLKQLDESRLTDNTLVIFTSDNGGILKNGANNGPWRSEKQHMYEGGIRVPAALRWPGVIKPGSATELQAQTMDIFATICEAAGIKAPAGTDAVSFLPTLRGEQQPTPARDLYFVRREGGVQYGGKTIEALRRGDWKLVQDSPFSPLELFNLKEDPMETTDRSSQQKKIFNELSAALRKHIQRGGQVPWQDPEH